MSLIRWAPVGLAAIAEGSWIAVVAGFAQEVVLRLPVVTVAEFVVAVVAGVAVARGVGVRLGDRWPPLALGLAVAGGLGGVLGSPRRSCCASSGEIDGNRAGTIPSCCCTKGLRRSSSHASSTIRWASITAALS
jgi:hypothetical protein